MLWCKQSYRDLSGAYSTTRTDTFGFRKCEPKRIWSNNISILIYSVPKECLDVNPAEKKQYNPGQNTIENVMDLMVIMGIVLVLMETIMVSTGM